MRPAAPCPSPRTGRYRWCPRPRPGGGRCRRVGTPVRDGRGRGGVAPVDDVAHQSLGDALVGDGAGDAAFLQEEFGRVGRRLPLPIGLPDQVAQVFGGRTVMRLLDDGNGSPACPAAYQPRGSASRDQPFLRSLVLGLRAAVRLGADPHGIRLRARRRRHRSRGGPGPSAPGGCRSAAAGHPSVAAERPTPAAAAAARKWTGVVRTGSAVTRGSGWGRSLLADNPPPGTSLSRPRAPSISLSGGKRLTEPSAVSPSRHGQPHRAPCVGSGGDVYGREWGAGRTRRSRTAWRPPTCSTRTERSSNPSASGRGGRTHRSESRGPRSWAVDVTPARRRRRRAATFGATAAGTTARGETGSAASPSAGPFALRGFRAGRAPSSSGSSATGCP